MATAAPKNVFQFKITLSGLKPPIWRRIQVPENLNFADFHECIQDSMGWVGYHLHQFHVNDPMTNIPLRIGKLSKDGWFDEDLVPEKKVFIRNFFGLGMKKGRYEYDFGDGWMHQILLEKIVPALEGVEYPICLAGKRACPVEDCGGVWGYQELLQILANPSHPEYQERMDHLHMQLGSETFDPEKFDPKTVSFDIHKDWFLRSDSEESDDQLDEDEDESGEESEDVAIFDGLD